MRRYWIEKKDIQGNEVHFTGDVLHHIFDVCRQQVGSKFEVLTEDSKAYFVEVTSVSRKAASAIIHEERQIPSLPTPHIHIALSISRFPVMDAIMEKAVEMGVKSITPFFSEFSFLRKEDKISTNKTDRWDKIVRSATQQSGRGDLMKIHAPIPFEELFTIINQNDQNLGLFAYEGESTHGVKTYLQKVRGNFEKNGHVSGTDNSPVHNITNIWIIVGSEGGFSFQEVEQFRRHGLEPVTIGKQVLRVETACIALVSALKYEFDLMN